MSISLEPLLALQEHDLALEALQHRRDTLAVRDAVAAAETRSAALATREQGVRVQRDDLALEETRLDDEARSLEAKAKEVDKKMYSGEISSPRELQAMQADIDQLQRHQRDVETRELEFMEQREPLEADLVQIAGQQAELATELAALRASLAEAEDAIDSEMAAERGARAGVAAELDATLLDAYEKRRANTQGVGAARLVGSTCQGCHLSIPSTEVERIRKAPEGSIAYCDNCGCILIP